MDDQEAIEMMQRSVSEIRILRGQIDILRPKADAYDNMAALIGLLPKPSQGYGEDLAWRLEKRIDELKKKSAS